jgi:hypothetical protein
MTPLYLPATLANLMHLGKSTRPATTVLQLPLRYGWLNASPAKLPPEVSAVVTFVSGQAGRAFLGTPLWSGHSYLVTTFSPTVTSETLAAVTSKARSRPWPSVTRWTVLPLPYPLGRSRHLAPERKTQRMPLMVRRSSARGRPRTLGGGSSGAMSAHWSSPSSPSITQASHLET